MDIITHAAIAAAGGDHAWNELGPETRELHLAMARTMAEHLVGKLAPWEHVEVGIKVTLMRSRGALADRKHGDDATGRVARDIVAEMKRSGYTIIAGVPAKGWGSRFLAPYVGEPENKA